MKKYIAKLLFNINIDNGSHHSQFDEQVRIIESYDHEAAFYKARALGKKEEVTFHNKENQPVSWQFIDVAGLYPLEEIKDGEEVYSVTHEIKDPNSYIKFIRLKSMEIQTKALTFS